MRGLSPYPAAWTELNGKTYKIYKISPAEYKKESRLREIATDNKNYLYVKTADGWISVDELQPEGKKKMSIQEFLRGNKI